MPNGILGMIANPPQVDMPGAMLAGQKLAQNRNILQQQQFAQQDRQRLQQQQQRQGAALSQFQTGIRSGGNEAELFKEFALENPKKAIEYKKAFMGLDDAMMKSVALDTLAALTMPDGKDQIKMLGQAQTKVPRDSDLYKSLEEAKNMGQDERDKYLIGAVSFYQDTKLLPPKGKPIKAEKTAGQIERETGVKEGSLELKRDIFEQSKLEFLNDQKKGREAPKGFEFIKNGTELQRIKGGPAYLKEKENARKAILMAKKSMSASNIVIDTSKRALAKINRLSTGLLGKSFKKIGGTQATDMQGMIDTMQANISFAELSAMRRASPTGGALGNVTEGELKLLGTTLGSLSIDQSAEELRNNIQTVFKIYTETLAAARQDYGELLSGTPAGASGGIQNLSDDELNAIANQG